MTIQHAAPLGNAARIFTRAPLGNLATPPGFSDGGKFGSSTALGALLPENSSTMALCICAGINYRRVGRLPITDGLAAPRRTHRCP